jgi:hypothetical protein
VVALPGRRPWRSLAGPVALLLAATLAVVLLRAVLTDGGGEAPAPATRTAPAQSPAGPRFHVVQAGDTLATIAADTGVPVKRLEQLNPQVAPTALFIGDRIRLR